MSLLNISYKSYETLVHDNGNLLFTASDNRQFISFFTQIFPKYLFPTFCSQPTIGGVIGSINSCYTATVTNPVVTSILPNAKNIKITAAKLQLFATKTELFAAKTQLFTAKSLITVAKTHVFAAKTCIMSHNNLGFHGNNLGFCRKNLSFRGTNFKRRGSNFSHFLENIKSLNKNLFINLKKSIYYA